MTADLNDSYSVPISVMIFTLDEEVNLPACLSSLHWCDDVIVIDSFSADRTEELSRAAGARFYQHRFEGFGLQRNWALENTQPKHAWVLILDADERVPPELVEEMSITLRGIPEKVGAFRLKRRFYMWGRWLKHSSLYPTWVVRLVHKDRVRYVNRGHAETQEVNGEVRDLEHDLIDENLKGIDEWFERQNRYAGKDAEYELSRDSGTFSMSDMVSGDPLVRRAAFKRAAGRIPGRAFWYFIYSYVVRRGFRDGRDGLMFCFMKAMYQGMVSVKKYDMRREESRR